jgi:O-antigen ligase
MKIMHASSPQAASEATDSISSATYGLILVIFVLVGRVQEIIPGLAALSLGKVTLGLALILSALAAKKSDIPVFASRQVKCIFGIFSLGIISSFFSFWRGQSIIFMLVSYLSAMILVLLVIKIIGSFKDLRAIIWGTLLSLTLHGIIAIILGKTGGRVAAGGDYDPNDLAFIMVVFFPLAYFMMRREKGIQKLILLGICLIYVITIAATQSRGGFLGFVVVMLAILVMGRIGFIKSGIGIIAVVLAFSFFASGEYKERLSTLLQPEQDYNVTEGGGRIAIWKRGIHLMMEYPLLGVGPQAFPVAEGAMHTDPLTGQSGKWSAAHNSFVQMGAELGFPGLILLVLLLYSSIKTLRSTRRLLRETSELRPILIGVEIGLYGYITSGFFLSQAYSTALLLLAGMSVVLEELARQENLQGELSGSQSPMN